MKIPRNRGAVSAANTLPSAIRLPATNLYGDAAREAAVVRLCTTLRGRRVTGESEGPTVGHRLVGGRYANLATTHLGGAPPPSELVPPMRRGARVNLTYCSTLSGLVE